MRSLLVCGVFAGFVFAVVASLGVAEEPVAKNPHIGHLRHVVLFQYKEGTTPEVVKKIEDAFRALPSKVPSVIDFECGTNCSEEGHSQGLTACFMVTFKDAKGRAEYLPHPAHKEFVSMLLPHLAKVLVVDYVVKE